MPSYPPCMANNSAGTTLGAASATLNVSFRIDEFRPLPYHELARRLAEAGGKPATGGIDGTVHVAR